MLKAISAINSLLGTILGLAIVGMLGTIGWVGYQTYYGEKDELERRQTQIDKLTKDLEADRQEIDRLGSELDASRRDIAAKAKEIDDLNIDLEAKKKEIERLDTAIRLLKVDHRLARIKVLGQTGSEEEGNLTTKFSFVGIDDQGNELETPRVFTIEGDRVYIDAWVIKFTDDLITLPDPVRSTSFCQFRRIFGESQRPIDGFVLDTAGSRPAAYGRGEQMSDLEKEIWAHFWEYANNPTMAREKGIRAVQGEAPSIKLMLNRQYKVLLRASDGLTIVTEEASNAPSGETF